MRSAHFWHLVTRFHAHVCGPQSIVGVDFRHFFAPVSVQAQRFVRSKAPVLECDEIAVAEGELFTVE